MSLIIKYIDRLYKANIIIAPKKDLKLFDELFPLYKNHHKNKVLIPMLKRFSLMKLQYNKF